MFPYIADGGSSSLSVWFSGLGMVNCSPVSLILSSISPVFCRYDLGPIDFRDLACDHSISPDRFIRLCFLAQ